MLWPSLRMTNDHPTGSVRLQEINQRTVKLRAELLRRAEMLDKPRKGRRLAPERPSMTIVSV